MSTDMTPMDELREHYDQTDQAAALADATQETATGAVLVSSSSSQPEPTPAPPADRRHLLSRAV